MELAVICYARMVGKKKPKVTIRIHPARTSNTQFIQDMVNSVEEVDGKPMQLQTTIAASIN